MGELWTYPFIRRAVVASILVGALASYYGVFVVQRRQSFLGTGLAHAAFGGVALGLLLGAEPLLVALPFTVAVALGINWVRDRSGLADDTAVGIFFAVAVALGIVFISLRDRFAVDAFAYLFGSVLAVSSVDLWVIVGVALAALLFARRWGRWAYASFDRELARADGLSVVADDRLLSVLLAVTLVAAVKVVGLILVAAFLVIPPATVRLAATTFRTMTLLSVGLGVGSGLVGLAASFALDLPSGATMVLAQAAVFFSVLLTRR